MKHKLFHPGFILVLLTMLGLELHAQSSYMKKVNKALVKGDTVKAIKKLNGYINKHPEMAELHLERAKLKVQMGDYDPAMVDLNSYCSLVEDCEDAQYWKGMIRYGQRDFNGAIEHLSKYTIDHPDAKAWTFLGTSHMWLQHHELALNAFQRSLELDPNQAETFYNAGLCAFRLDRYDRAISHFKRARAVDPEDSDILMALANTYTQQGSFAESIAILAEIKEDDPAFPNALFNTAVNHYRNDDTKTACEWWSAAEEAGHMNAEDNIKRYCDEK